MLRAVALSMALLASGCGSIPEGVFKCSRDADCPSGWFCRSDERCWSSLDGGVDAGMRDAGAVDAGQTDASIDAGPDAGMRDGGGPPECPPSCDDNNPCTDDVCNTAVGVCDHPPNSASCTGTSMCATSWVCMGGICRETSWLANDTVVSGWNRCCEGGTTLIGTDVNPVHCGMCDRACMPGETCANGNCISVP